METEEQPNLIQRLLSKIDVKEVGATFGEIGFGTGLDIATTPLLVSPIPGSRVAYGGINFLGGAGANYVAQQARTEEDLEWYDRDWGEIISSGLLGIIPGMSGKAGKLTPLVGRPNTYRRAATFGAGSGITDQFIRRGIDEGRLPTGEEIATGGLTGSVAGPVFKKSFDEVAKIFTKYRGKSSKEVNALIELDEAEHLSKHLSILQRGILEANEAGDMSKVRKLIFDYRKAKEGGYPEYKSYDDFKENTENFLYRLNDNLDGIPLQQRLIFAQSGMRGGKLDVDLMRSQGWMGAATSRYGLETFMTRSDQFVPDFFEEEKRRLLPGFIAEYAPYLRSKGVSEDKILALRVGQHVNLHHITPLKSGADLYHGTDHGDAEWTAVTDIFNEFDLFPGAPATSVPSLKNWLYVLQEPHNLLHHQFLKDNIGLQGEVFFTPERKALLRSGIEGRKQVAREYAAIIRRGKDLIEDMMDQFQIAFGQTNPSPEKLTEILHRSLEDGTIPLLESGYSLRSQEEIARKIIEVSDLVRAQYDAEFIEPIRRSEALTEAREAAQSAETQARIAAEDERFAQLNADIDSLTREMANREGTFTRFSTLEDARIKAEELVSRYDTSGQLRVLFADEMTYEAVVERLARLLYENPNAQF